MKAFEQLDAVPKWVFPLLFMPPFIFVAPFVIIAGVAFISLKNIVLK